jgi:hypothetical protein
MEIKSHGREALYFAAAHQSAAIEWAMLHLDDVGTEIAQDLAGVGRHDDRRELHHPQAVQRASWCLR